MAIANDSEHGHYLQYANICMNYPGGAVVPYSFLEWVAMGRPKGVLIADGKWPAPTTEDLPKVSDASHRS